MVLCLITVVMFAIAHVGGWLGTVEPRYNKESDWAYGMAQHYHLFG